eukprot:756424-Pelagomonas_calceolata.AAC.11
MGPVGQGYWQLDWTEPAVTAGHTRCVRYRTGAWHCWLPPPRHWDTLTQPSFAITRINTVVHVFNKLAAHSHHSRPQS